MPKIQQTPWSLVGYEAVGGSQGEGVKGQKAHEASVGIRKTFARECGENTNQRQEKDQSFAPNWPVVGMKKEKSMEVKVPWMNMRRITRGAIKPRRISANGIQEARSVGEEGGEHQKPD